MHVNVVSHFGRNLFTFTVSRPSRGRRSRVDLHPCHLVCHLLHCGWRAVMLGVGWVWPWHVPSSRVVMLRNSRPENTKMLFKHMDKDPGRRAFTTRVHTNRDALKQTNKTRTLWLQRTLNSQMTIFLSKHVRRKRVNRGMNTSKVWKIRFSQPKRTIQTVRPVTTASSGYDTKQPADRASTIIIAVIIKMSSCPNTVGGRGDVMHVDSV